MKTIQLKVAARNNGIIFVAALIFMTFSSQASAVCSRDDVEFYLGKGFSTDQITTLCSESSTPVNNDSALYTF